MDDVKRPRLFLHNPDSGEPWAYCGTLPTPTAPGDEWAVLARALGDFVAGEVANDFGGAEPGTPSPEDVCFSVEIKRVDMTDAEVAALPEM